MPPQAIHCPGKSARTARSSAATQSAWLTPAVVSLAEAAYARRILPSGHLDPARLAVLADALEEAGCTDETILSHCRGPGPHVRGCWCVDQLLGKLPSEVLAEPRMRLEPLEGRDVPSTLTVTNANDGGAGSLRAAIAAARSGDTIRFAPALIGQTITPGPTHLEPLTR